MLQTRLDIGSSQNYPWNYINGSVVYYSIVFRSNNHVTVMQSNPDKHFLFKYVDYINLIVPENTDVCLLEKFDRIKEWARK